jgi:hypothetical protein
MYASINMVKIIGILLSAAPHIERLQKPASFFQILLEPAFDLFTAGASGNRECLGTPQ